MTINFNNLKEIDRGRRSVVYKVNDKQVLKLYDIEYSKDLIFDEFKNTISIRSNCTNLNIPKPIEFVCINNQYGILYEYIDGTSLMNKMMKSPLQYLKLSNQVTELHKEVHKNSAKLISQEEKYMSSIQSSEYFSDDEKKKLISILNKPYESVICHGDFHHGNIIQTEQEVPYIIDWSDSFSGSFKLDVALTAVNSIISKPPEHIPFIFSLGYWIIKNIFRLDRRYLRHYGVSFNEINEYIYLASAIHLLQSEGDNTEHIKYFRKSFNNLKGE